MRTDCGCLSKREFGILLHVTSLPGPGADGDLGPESYRFVDFLARTGARVWQVLPLVPTHACGSPYNAQSVHAGNPRLISAVQLCADGVIGDETLRAYQTRASHDATSALRWLLDRIRRVGFRDRAGADVEIERFRKASAGWLPDYALYRVLKRIHDEAPWYLWPEPLRDRDPDALARIGREHGQSIRTVELEQYLFQQQWARMRSYANRCGIRILGDMSFYPAHDSADVWANRHYFQLDDAGRAHHVAGVPPDYFSATGQRWGNPLYAWPRLCADDFKWWIQRIRSQLGYFDMLRLDHFRGFESGWSIPASDDATAGRWEPAPGRALFESLLKTGDSPPLIAEDLGHITSPVEDLRRRFGLPGMRVLQFAFDAGADNHHLPHYHEHCGVVYTGTHDNQTTLGWFDTLDVEQRTRVFGYLGMPSESMPWALIRTAMASVCRLAIVPMQDVMALGDFARMNRPGTESGNWTWRLDWAQVPAGSADRLQHLASVYDRLSW